MHKFLMFNNSEVKFVGVDKQTLWAGHAHNTHLFRYLNIGQREVYNIKGHSYE